MPPHRVFSKYNGRAFLKTLCRFCALACVLISLIHAQVTSTKHTDPTKVVRLGVTTAADTTGTIVTGFTSAVVRDFVILYDNIAGTGIPLAATFLESDGTANTTTNSYTAAYSNTVNGVNGAFAEIIPNILPNGIRRVERRSLTIGNIVGEVTDADGVWPSGKSTVNPSGGTTALFLADSDLTFTPVSVNNPTTNIRFDIREAGFVSLKVYDLSGEEIATLKNEQQGPGIYSVVFSASELSSGMYRYQLKTGNYTEMKKTMVLK